MPKLTIDTKPFENRDTFSCGEVVGTYKRKIKPAWQVSDCEDLDNYARKRCYKPGTIGHKEYLFAIYLDQHENVVGHIEISNGGIATTIADPKLIIQGALLCNSTRFALVHNHPSGNLTPSHQDLLITQRMMLLCNLLDLTLVDHLIVADDRQFRPISLDFDLSVLYPVKPAI